MQLESFLSKDLNGFLDINIRFFHDVSFLHGINGSGKTTILKAITSMLTPDLQWIAFASFSRLKLSIIHNEQRYNITLVKSEARSLEIFIGGALQAHGVIDLELLTRVISIDTASKNDLNIRNFIQSNQALVFIRSLPSPIFLGLDRTTLVTDNNRGKTYPFGRDFGTQKVFRTLLDEALDQSVEVVKSRIATISRQRNVIFSEAQRKLVLAIFDIDANEEAQEKLGLYDISKSTKKSISKMKTEVVRGLTKMHIPKSDLDSSISPFFMKALDRASIATEAHFKQMKTEDSTPEEASEFIKYISPWYSIAPYLALAANVLKIIEDANGKETEVISIVDNYTKIINSFIGDSGKRILLDNETVKVVLKNGDLADIGILSSGERQIFVLITHLAMNPDMQKTNVLIIDEPELSLHLKWQKQFVASVQKASPNTQIILATHSPEIIGDATNRLIGLVS